MPPLWREFSPSARRLSGSEKHVVKPRQGKGNHERDKSRRLAGIVIALVLGFRAYLPRGEFLCGDRDTRVQAPMAEQVVVHGIDETGRTIFTTGHTLHVGDEFIAEDDTVTRSLW